MRRHSCPSQFGQGRRNPGPFSLPFAMLGFLLAVSLACGDGGPFDFLGAKAPIPHAMPEMDAAARVVLFEPEWLRPVLPDCCPAEATSAPLRLQACAAQGEYEPFCFAARADKATALSFCLQPLVHAGGKGRIDSTNLQLRAQLVLFPGDGQGGKQRVPAAMEQLESYPLRPQETMLFCLDLFVPPGTPEGLYASSLRVFQHGGALLQDVPIRLRVLPFPLKRDVRSYGSFFCGCYFSNKVRARNTYASPAMLARVFAAHHAYGLNSIEFFEVTPVLRYLPEQDAVEADFGQIEALVDAWRAAGNGGMVALEIRYLLWWCDELATVLEGKGTGGRRCFTPQSLSAEGLLLGHLEGNIAQRWSAAYRPSPRALGYLRQVIRQLLETIRRKQWGEVYLAPDEELGNGGIKLWGFLLFAPVLREFPEAKVLLVDNSPALGTDLGHLHPELASLRQYNRVTETTIRNAREDGCPLWVYNQGWTRGAFSFPLWKLGAGGAHMWADQWADVNAYDENCRRYNCFTLFYPSPEGPLPTMEAVRAREGIDDLAYLDTLLDWMERAECAGRKEAAAAARAVLERLSRTWPATTDESRAWAAAMTAQSAFITRWKLASEILKLCKACGEEAK